MKKFFAALLLVGVIGFVGCKEETTGDKVDKVMDDAGKKADEMKKKASEAAE